MDTNHVRRSVSHGSLRSSHRAQSRPGSRLSHRPLRSVNESANNLLPSPGPLESMLKTTTETGDIGIFTIKPIAPAATIHHCARSRPGIDASSIFRSESRASIRTEGQISRGRRGSDRDTNSEIFSLYGSEGNPSGLSSLSPAHRADPFRRSYSMTSSVPRRQRSSQTLQSHYSSALQRPRSPFPYPTRLKRPGVRPSSPAVTESGRVDYSRMVELDRVSFRTVHGSYKPTYLSPRLAPSHLNQSMPSLPYGALRAAQFGQDGRSHSQSGTFTSNWNNDRPVTARRPSIDQSMRSASLTSVIDMYYRSTSGSDKGSTHAVRPAGSFYYDYTEGFESTERSPDDPVSTPVPPLAPIPQRASSLVKALVLRDETRARLDAVVDISVKDSSDSSGEGNQARCSSPPAQFQDDGSREILPTLAPFPFEERSYSVSSATGADSQRRSLDLFSYFSEDGDFQLPAASGNKSTLQNRQPSSADVASCGANNSAAKEEILHEQDQLHVEPHDLGAQPDAVCTTSNLAMKADPAHGTLRKSLSVPATNNVLSQRASSHGGLAALLRSSLRYSVDPGLSDLAALVSSFERIAKSPFMRKDKETLTEFEDTYEYLSSSSPQEEGNVGAAHPVGDKGIVEPEANIKIRPTNSFSKRHRRNRAVARISTTNFRSTTPTSVRSANTAILCPEPVSPAHQLRVRNSIPQLMKALPALPDDLGRQSPSVSVTSAEDVEFPVKFAPFQLEILTTPRSSPRITKKQKEEDHESLKASIELDVEPDRPSTDRQSIDPAVDQTRQAAIHECPTRLANSDVTFDTSKKSPSRRLRTQTSPGVLGVGGCLEGSAHETLVRNKTSSRHNILKSLAEDSSEDLLTPAQCRNSHVNRAYQRKGRRFRLVTLPDGRKLHPLPSPTDTNSSYSYIHERDIPLAHPVDDTLRPSSSIEGYDLSDSRSFSSDLTFIRPRILRKKLSHLKIRMTRSRMNLKGRSIGSTDSGATIGPHGRTATSGPGQPKRMGRRVKGWFRRAVHIVIKRR